MKRDRVRRGTWDSSRAVRTLGWENPGNIDIDYLMNLDMAINSFLSANLIFQAIYDDNAVGAFQIREVFGLGVNVAL